MFSFSFLKNSFPKEKEEEKNIPFEIAYLMLSSLFQRFVAGRRHMNSRREEHFCREWCGPAGLVEEAPGGPVPPLLPRQGHLKALKARECSAWPGTPWRPRGPASARTGQRTASLWSLTSACWESLVWGNSLMILLVCFVIWMYHCSKNRFYI